MSQNTLNFNDGKKTYVVNGSCEISFYPSDFGLITRLLNAGEKIEKIISDFENFKIKTENSKAVGEKMDNADKEIRACIDELFGDCISQKLFGIVNCLSLANGSPVVINFIEAVFPVISNEIEKEGKLSQKRVEKYTRQVVEK